MSRFDAKILIDKYQQGQCSPEEQAVVEHWLTYGEFKGLDLTAAELEEDLQELRQRLGLKPLVAGTADGRENDNADKTKVRRLRVAVWAAAAVATIVFGLWFFKYEIASEATQPRNDVSVNDVAPGKYGATITLPGGRVAPLSSAKRGVVIGSGRGLLYDDGSEVAVPVEGQDQRRTNSGLVTVQTAKGQTYELTLPDGTRVWLNANSKLDFYAQFSGKYRKVFIEGEAYFEVFKNPASVFQVFTKPLPGRNQQLVEVLGTHFNINAYPDEPVNKTTLLEGSVTINNSLLKPGHQATLMGGGIILSEVDTEEAIAWKDNKFSFDSESLGSIMRKVERWYDVQVQYGDGVDQQMRFSGSVSRFDNVSSVLRMLSKTSNLKFRIEGRSVYISP